MRRIITGMVLLAVGLVGAAGVARGEACSPAMCAGMSPACWKAYEKAIVAKNEQIRDVARCRQLAADLDGAGSFLKVPELSPRAALCACEAAFWSMDGGAQGLPEIDDTTQEDSNSSDAVDGDD